MPLSDIYVPPHLKYLNIDIDELVKPIDVNKKLTSSESLLIFGDEQSGKTSLAKYLYQEFLKIGHMPVFLDGKHVSTSSLEELIRKSLANQYLDIDIENYKKSLNKVLIVDNFSEIQLNKKYINNFVKRSNEIFERTVFLALDSYQYVAREIDETAEYEYLQILPLGNLKRSEIVERWVSLGVVEQIEEKQLYERVDELKLRLDSLVRRNVVPPKPIFVLTMMQMFEAYTPQNLELTSYGHCYQYLVYQALEKASIKPTEIDKYLNILTELAWAFYKKKSGLDCEEINRFFVDYKKSYVLKDNVTSVIQKLTGNGLLSKRDGIISFKYPYVYYFFVAKKIAESFNSDTQIKNEIRNLLSQLHREDSANTIIFISHHTKDSWILDEIQLCLMELFDEQKEASLSSESLSFMEEFIAEIPDLVLEHKEVETVRREKDEVIDEIERIESVNEERDLEPSDILVRINKVFKCIEIVGQILRNRHASIHRDLLCQMIEFATNTGLRFLQYFLEISDVSRDEVIKMIEHMLRENPAIRVQDVEKEAKSTFLFLTYGVIFGVLRKISNSIGSKEADEIYDELESKINTPAVQLINQAISLQFKKQLDLKKLNQLCKNFRSNPTCMRMLKEIVVQHTYMFPVDYKDKQKISETLGLTMQGQRLISLQKEMKI